MIIIVLVLGLFFFGLGVAIIVKVVCSDAAKTVGSVFANIFAAVAMAAIVLVGVGPVVAVAALGWANIAAAVTG